MKGWKAEHKFYRMTKIELNELINKNIAEYEATKDDFKKPNEPVMAFVLFKSMSNTHRVFD